MSILLYFPHLSKYYLYKKIIINLPGAEVTLMKPPAPGVGVPAPPVPRPPPPPPGGTLVGSGGSGWMRW